MSRQNQRFASPFGAGRKQPDGLNSQNYLSGTGVQAALGGLGYTLNGRPLQNGANGIPFLQPPLFASPKAPAARANSEPPTPTANGSGTAAGRPAAQTPSRAGNVASSPKLATTYSVNTTPARKNSGGQINTLNGTSTGTLAGIARLVDTAVRNGPPPAGTGGAGPAPAPTAAGLSVIGASARGGPGAGLSSTMPANLPPTAGQAALLSTTGGQRPSTNNGMTSRAIAAVPGFSFTVGSNQSMGSRGYQEDYRVIADTTATPGLSHLPNILLGAAVYDGHGGKQVSHWLASSYCLLNRTMEAVQQLIAAGGGPNDVAAVLDEVFVTCGNAAMLGRMSAGSCVALSLLVQAAGSPWVLSANVGDSRTVLVSWDDGPDGRAEVAQLSVDHKLGPAKTSEETRRVQAAGGTVIQLFGTWRIDGSLAVARAIGDCDFARYVSCRPTVQCRELRHRDRWLIIASDGLWDVMTNEEVALFCRAQHQLAPAKLSEALVREAVRNRGSGDNTTVVAVRLHYSPPA